MRLKPRLSWFATEKGRQCVFAGICTTGIGILCANMLPQTMFLEKFKDIVQMYRGGEGVKVPTKVLKRGEEVMDKMNLPEKERSLIKFFTVYGFDPFYAGSTATTGGAYIGIPYNFSYDKVTEVEKNTITVKGEPFAWSSAAGQELLESVVLSENAQKFAIATQIHQSRSLHIYTNTITASVCFLSAYSFAHSANFRLNGFSRPLSFRVLLYSLIGSFMTGMWALLKDMANNGLENAADKEVAEMSIDLAKGGLEFYEKILRRNVALRELMGPDGEATFAASGNPQIFIRTKHVPITIRRDNLRKFVKSKLESEESVIS